MTPQQFRQNAALAIDRGRDPALLTIPRKGETLTLEEYVTYLFETLPRPFLS